MVALRSSALALALLVVAPAVTVFAQGQVAIVPRAVCPGGTLTVIANIGANDRICLFAKSLAFETTSSGSTPVWLGVFDGPTVTLPFTFGTDVEPFEVFVKGVVLPESGSTYRTNIDEAAVIESSISWSVTSDDLLTFPTKTDWLVVDDLPFTQLIDVSTVPSGYEDEVTVAFAQVAPAGNGALSALSSTLWQYTSFADPPVSQCFEQVGGTEQLEPQVGGVNCGDKIKAEVISVFEYLADELEDYERAYQWVTSVRQEWLSGLSLAGTPLAFSSLTFVSSSSTYCGVFPFGVDAVACTGCFSSASTFAAGAFTSEWALASTVLHELVHTAGWEYCQGDCGDYWAYSFELLAAPLTFIQPCDAQYLSETSDGFAAECPGCGTSCP